MWSPGGPGSLILNPTSAKRQSSSPVGTRRRKLWNCWTPPTPPCWVSKTWSTPFHHGVSLEKDPQDFGDTVTCGFMTLEAPSSRFFMVESPHESPCLILFVTRSSIFSFNHPVPPSARSWPMGLPNSSPGWSQHGLAVDGKNATKVYIYIHGQWINAHLYHVISM